MKKKSLSFLFALIVTNALISCNQETEIIEPEHALEFTYFSTPVSTIEKVKSWYFSNKIIQKNLSTKSIDYDFDNSISYKIDDLQDAIIINQKGINQNNKENHAISFVKNKTEIGTFYKIKTISETSNLKKVEFYSFTNELIFTTIFDNNLRKINTKFEDNYAAKGLTGDCYDASYGQYIVDCVEDVYTSRGWLSVWASIQTVFIPQTAVALTAACAVEGLTNGNCYTSF